MMVNKCDNCKGSVCYCVKHNEQQDIVTELESKLAKARVAFSEILLAHTSHEPASMIAKEALKEIE